MSNCNKKHTSDTSPRTTLKTKPTHDDEGEINNELAIFVEDCNGNEPDVPSLENREHENKDEKLNSISPEDETKAEKGNVHEDDILELNVQDEIDLKNVESSQDNMEISDNMADACKTVCEICHKTFTLTNMRNHTLKAHKVQITEYKQMYGNFSIIRMVYHKCHLCGKTVLLDNDTLGGHIKGTHKMKEKDYKAQFMTLVSSKLQSTQNVNKNLDKEDGDDAEQNANIDMLKRGRKRKHEKVDCSSKISKKMKETPSSLVRKQKQSRGSNKSVLKKNRKSKRSSKKINLEANSVKEEMMNLLKDKPTEDIKQTVTIIDNTLAASGDITDNAGDVAIDVHENSPTEDTSNADSIIDKSQDVAKDIESTKYEVENITDNSDNIVAEYFTDFSKDAAAYSYSEWISDCELNGLFCNGGPTVKKGWRFCFEERTIDGCQVMFAKYMSPTGSIYVRGENGYQIPDLML